MIPTPTVIAPVQYHKGEYDPASGWWVTPQEAYTDEEWEEHAKTCHECGDQFVVYTAGDEDIDTRGSKYCGDECRKEVHRRESREYNRRKAAERSAS